MPAPFLIPTPKTGPFLPGPDSQRQPGVPCGTVVKAEWRSAIFPGTVREYWVYVPAQYTPDKPAAVTVFQDGGHDGKHAGAILPESPAWLWR